MTGHMGLLLGTRMSKPCTLRGSSVAFTRDPKEAGLFVEWLMEKREQSRSCIYSSLGAKAYL
jgi:hypothetical protein